jgi:UDP-N-acetylmuramate--alanine ligase
MSGIAEVLVNLGYNWAVQMFNRRKPPARLQKLGAKIVIGHAAENVGNADVVVTSTAVERA